MVDVRVAAWSTVPPIGAGSESASSRLAFLISLFTILHISDLHRSADDPISNDELISTLIADRDRYAREEPKIAPPDAIIVSGDLVQGAPIGSDGYRAVISDQYETALQFLSELADRFVDGDRSRVVLVPGNHDVDWNASRLAMAEVPRADWPADLYGALGAPGTRLRWSWGEQTLLRISDEVVYASRFAGYRAMAARFYDGVVLSDPYDPSADWNLFELCDGRIAAIAFNSCFDNDCCRLVGAIQEPAVARSHVRVHEKGPYELQLAIWHHSVSGPPEHSDYLDVSTVHKLIGKGFRLGLHGHQHRAEAVPHVIHLPEQEMMVVAGAGSLCAGASALPPGVNRQYNIIEIRDDLSGARIHVREIAVATVFGPGRMPELGGNAYADFDWPPVLDDMGRVPSITALKLAALVERAEGLYQRGEYAEALSTLTGLDLTPGSYQRKLALNAAEKAGDWASILAMFVEPTTPEEVMAVVSAHVELRDFESAQATVDTVPREILADATRRDIIDMINVQRDLHP
jgi:hypothetical protein